MSLTLTSDGSTGIALLGSVVRELLNQCRGRP
jgi:hypothetical protein